MYGIKYKKLKINLRLLLTTNSLHSTRILTISHEFYVKSIIRKDSRSVT